MLEAVYLFVPTGTTQDCVRFRTKSGVLLANEQADGYFHRQSALVDPGGQWFESFTSAVGEAIGVRAPSPTVRRAAAKDLRGSARSRRAARQGGIQGGADCSRL